MIIIRTRCPSCNVTLLDYYQTGDGGKEVCTGRGPGPGELDVESEGVHVGSGPLFSGKHLTNPS